MAKKTASKLSYIEEARKRLGRIVVTNPERQYFDLGNPALNAMLGKPGQGLFNGEIIELRGEASTGKSALAMVLEELVIAGGGVAHHADLENSWDESWALVRGVSQETVNVIKPYVTLEKTEKVVDKKALLKLLKEQNPEVYHHVTIPSAEEILQEVETCLAMAYADDPTRFQLVVIDSVATLLPHEELDSGLDQNMRTKLALPIMVGRVLKQWTAKFMLYNAALVLINQIRTNPMQMFGDNRVSPGGRGMEFFPHVRVNLTRTNKAREVNGKKVGIEGKARVSKQKAGGPEGALYEYFLPFNDSPYEIEEG
jgi:RecA/RadA recombinase